jgi:hypothetical protein
LTKDDFFSVISYLAGDYALEDRHVYAKIWYDADKKEVGKRGAMARVIYMTNIGTIPEEGFIDVVVGSGGRKGQSEASRGRGIPEGLTFDDVLLLPGYTEVRRQQVDLTTRLHPSITLTLPILSSPMDTVTEEGMAAAMAMAGGLGIIHRNIAAAEQGEIVQRVKNGIPRMLGRKMENTAAVDARGRLLVGAAVGVFAVLPLG